MKSRLRPPIAESAPDRVRSVIELATYDLPDARLLSETEYDRSLVTWVPDNLIVVIGKGSRAGTELNLEAINAENIPVYRRPTGGCAVVLSPKMLAVSIAERGPDQIKSSVYFDRLNTLLINSLRNLGVENLGTAGSSDIAIGQKKIVGSALYRSRGMVFYHAIMNLAEEPDTIQRVLAMPPRMPDYREGRSHSDFVTSVAEAGWSLDADTVSEAIIAEWLRDGSNHDMTYVPLAKNAAMPVRL